MVLLRRISLRRKDSANITENVGTDEHLGTEEGGGSQMRQTLIASFKKQIDETRAKIAEDMAK